MSNILFRISWLVIFCCFTLEGMSQIESREYWQHNKRYLVCREINDHYFALEMSTCSPVATEEAKKMWDSANQSMGVLSSIPKEYFLDSFFVQRNTWCNWNNCAPRLYYTPRVQVAFTKDKQPGTIPIQRIRGFDDLVKRDKELVKDWKKYDKKQSINRWYHSPIVRYDTTHRRIFLVSYSGIAWVPEDSLEQGAQQVLGEIPGLRLSEVASPQYHRFIFLLYVPEKLEDIRNGEKAVCRVFDTHTMKLLKLPNSERMVDPSFVFCPSGDYVFAVHKRVVAPWSSFSPYLINLREWKSEGYVHLNRPEEKMRFYLDKKRLYIQTNALSKSDRLWVLDLAQNEKQLFQYPKDQQ